MANGEFQPSRVPLRESWPFDPERSTLQGIDHLLSKPFVQARRKLEGAGGKLEALLQALLAQQETSLDPQDRPLWEMPEFRLQLNDMMGEPAVSPSPPTGGFKTGIGAGRFNTRRGPAPTPEELRRDADKLRIAEDLERTKAFEARVDELRAKVREEGGIENLSFQEKEMLKGLPSNLPLQPPSPFTGVGESFAGPLQEPTGMMGAPYELAQIPQSLSFETGVPQTGFMWDRQYGGMRTDAVMEQLAQADQAGSPARIAVKDAELKLQEAKQVLKEEEKRQKTQWNLEGAKATFTTGTGVMAGNPGRPAPYE